MTILVNLIPDIEKRLLALASTSGESTEDQRALIIAQGLDDLEDYYAAADVLARVKRGEENVLSSEDFWRGLDQ